MTARVIAVSDGDTITVLDGNEQQHKVRIAGIDAPEKKQSFGELSKAHLADLVFGDEVDVVGDKLDRYGRTVAKVMMAPRSCLEIQCQRTEDAGLRQIEAGFAWWYRKYAKEQSSSDQTAYEAAEANAKASARGLWSQNNPIPPSEWRHSRAR